VSVKIVTDSTSDISPEVAHALDITIVPAYVQFDDEVYRDGIDISKDRFYQKLVDSFVPPTTSPPTPQDFAKVYSDCSKEAEDILSIHISAKISDTYHSALQGKKVEKGKCQIEVVDSRFASIGLALVVMAAARLARAGENLQSVLEEAQKAISQIHMLWIFDTMKYLVWGGRATKSVTEMADIRQIKPLLTFKDGEIIQAGLVRTYSTGVDRLYEFVKDRLNIQDLAIAYSTVPEQASQMKERLSSLFPEDKIYIAQLGIALGVHSGPGALVLALRQGE
jgi:DegV family protein with EDD domain